MVLKSRMALKSKMALKPTTALAGHHRKVICVMLNKI